MEKGQRPAAKPNKSEAPEVDIFIGQNGWILAISDVSTWQNRSLYF